MTNHAVFWGAGLTRRGKRARLFFGKVSFAGFNDIGLSASKGMNRHTSLGTCERQLVQRIQEIEVFGVQVMVAVQLGEDVRSVRWKISMEANEYLLPWRMINVGTFMSPLIR